MSWSETGPVSTPPRGTVTFIALLLVVVAVFGVGFGMRSVWRVGGETAAGAGDESQDAAAASARPLVDIPAVEQPPVATNAAAPAANTAAKDEDEDEANSIAEKTAAAQAVQSKTAEQPTDIDQMMASPSEKPQSAAKPSTDESAPGGPASNSSVPF
jgi:hypothetical protein